MKVVLDDLTSCRHVQGKCTGMSIESISCHINHASLVHFEMTEREETSVSDCQRHQLPLHLFVPSLCLEHNF